MGLITLWKNYLAWTQAVVVAPLIARAKRRWVEVAWFLVFVGTAMAFVAQSCYLVEDHFSYRKTTSIRLVYEPQAPFPAVTFCNLNPFKKSMVEHSQELTNLLSAYTYACKMKQAQTKSETSAAAETTATESHARKKRQQPNVPVGCDEALRVYDKEGPSKYYSVWICPNGTAFVEFTGCDDVQPLRTKTFDTSGKPSSWMEEMATIYYTCFNRFCAGGCQAYTDTFDAMVAERACLQYQLSELAGIVARAVADHCNYADATCHIGIGQTGSVYGGKYY